MEAKRFSDDSDLDPEKQSFKRIRTTSPSFASVIGEVVMVKNMKNLFSSLEPLLRKVVNEEVEHVLRCYSRSLTRSPSLRIQAATEEPYSSLALVFNKRLSLPIFTGGKISDFEGNSLQILLVEKNGDQLIPTSLNHAVKLQIVVLDGDFPSSDGGWTSEQFNSNVVKERAGKRPLLAGELNLTLRDGIAAVGDIEFTDNSSWIRSRKFRVGVRVAPGSYRGVQIREAMTEAFVVKDHRGELYKKHHPPMLNDEVWRLEKIGKEGAFHKKLAQENINTVQDFLKLSVIDLPKLRRILGIGMSEKMWEATIKHARTCEMGKRLYVLRGPHFCLVTNPICQVVRAEINGQVCSTKNLTNLDRNYIHKLVAEAYARWESLEVIDGSVNDVPLLIQGEMVERCSKSHQATIVEYEAQNGYMINGSIEFGFGQSQAQIGSINSPYIGGSGYGNGSFPYTVSESQSDDNVTSSISFIDGA